MDATGVKCQYGVCTCFRKPVHVIWIQLKLTVRKETDKPNCVGGVDRVVQGAGSVATVCEYQVEGYIRGMLRRGLVIPTYLLTCWYAGSSGPLLPGVPK